MRQLFILIKLLFLYAPIASGSVQEFQINENIPRDENIGKVIPKINAKITHFSMVAEDSIKQMFNLNGITGEISTRRLIDREEICKGQKDYSCYVEFGVFMNVDDSTISSTDLFINVRVLIKDLNDNLPRFDSPTKFMNVSEASVVNSNFSLPTAIDLDEHRFSIVDYKLENGNCEKNGGIFTEHFINDYFQLILDQVPGENIKPILNQIKAIDRETVAHLSGCLVAIDGESNTDKQRLIIKVIDINDNSPQWVNAPYNVSVNECQDHNGAFTNFYGRQLITNLEVDDADEGLFGKVDLKIIDPGKDIPKMTISNGKLYALSKLDHESLPKFEVKIEAIDGNGLTNITTVTVNVENCNDHAPTIQVIPRTKLISSLTDEERLLISMNPDTEIWLTEESPDIIHLAMIQAEDKDSIKDPQIECKLTRHNELISLLPTELKSMYILVKKEGAVIDREKVQIINIDITCKDNELPRSRETTKRLSIGVKDINDNKPFWPGENFHHQLHSCPNLDAAVRNKFKIFSVTEKSPIGTCFGVWPGRDVDMGINAQLNYSLEKSDLISQGFVDGSNYFSIDSKTSEICTKAPLDRETDPIFVSRIRVQDLGEPSLAASSDVIICVTDINDNPPKFLNQKNDELVIHFNIDEGRGHKVVGHFDVEDLDEGKNGTWFLTLDQSSILPRDQKVNFGISSNGDLTVSGELDRERIAEYRMIVKAIDKASSGHQLTSNAPVLVTVNDLNDNLPKLDITQTINISVSLEPGALIHQLVAHDEDEGENARVFFTLRIDNPLSEYFEISSISDFPDEAGRSVAEIRLKKSLMEYYRVNRNIKMETMKDLKVPFDRLIIYIQASNSESGNSKTSTDKLLINVFPENYQTSLSPYQSPKSALLNEAGRNSDDKSYEANLSENYTKSGSLTILLVLAAIVVCIFLGVLVAFAILYLKETNRQSTFDAGREGNNFSSRPNHGLLSLINGENEYATKETKYLDGDKTADWNQEDINKYTSLTGYTLENGDVYFPTKTLFLKSPLNQEASSNTMRSLNQSIRMTPHNHATEDFYQTTISKNLSDQSSWNSQHLRLVSPKNLLKNRTISPQSSNSSTNELHAKNNNNQDPLQSTNNKNLNNCDIDWSQNYTPLIENSLNTSGVTLISNSNNNEIIENDEKATEYHPFVKMTYSNKNPPTTLNNMNPSNLASYKNSNSLSSFV